MIGQAAGGNMDFKTRIGGDELEPVTGIHQETLTIAGADASALSESELELASAMISVSSPLPFRLPLEPH